MVKGLKRIFIILLALFNYLISQSVPFFSTKYSFSINFPSGVEKTDLDYYSHSFESIEVVGESFFFYQVQVMDERPDSPLKFKTKAENDSFLKSFIMIASLLYKNKIFLKKHLYFYDDKYYALEHLFKGDWSLINQMVYNRGITILQNNRIIKVSFIYPIQLKDNPVTNDKYHKFISSFRLI